MSVDEANLLSEISARTENSETLDMRSKYRHFKQRGEKIWGLPVIFPVFQGWIKKLPPGQKKKK